MAPPLVVFDTVVVVRALIGKPGNDNLRIVEAAGTGALRTALSDDGLRELRRIVGDLQTKIASPVRAFEVVNDLWSHGTLHHPQRYDWPSVNDPDDYWQPDLAFEAAADYIVTHDQHLLEAEIPMLPTKMVTPAELLQKLGL